MGLWSWWRLGESEIDPTADLIWVPASKSGFGDLRAEAPLSVIPAEPAPAKAGGWNLTHEFQIALHSMIRVHEIQMKQ